MKRRSSYANSVSAIGLIVSLVFAFESLFGCEQKTSTVYEPNELRLRQRIHSADEAFLQGRFKEFVAIRSERMRKRLFSSEIEKEKVFKQWETFVQEDKPMREPIKLSIEGTKATVTMKASVLDHNGQRQTTTLYDLWLFENGDWFLDDADRTSPDYFLKE